ncbi:TAXI family TRAP transporter solute-binding subunit [Salinicola endophyticus]|uniref:TAXI family TRAP transporter solute-binding subunit n=2 Tax=Salinicola endophyticus TaxID=1949083 RepID=A0ABY8FJB7_9GAMM|nr:TAXI family TRAP transporter solute-binding subunit [Salinicola endophyticus]WFF42898.1 TAXI family TRAP transporter solute-binding subunit [Salinicola endophyticus]
MRSGLVGGVGGRTLAGWLAAAAVWTVSMPAQAVGAITIGTGDTYGVYWPAGQEICHLYEAATGQRCQARITGGSQYNATAVRNGDLTFGIVQSDIQYAALNGSGLFYDSAPAPDLRALFSLQSEAFTVVATDPGIQRFSDLRERQVNVGNPGSGHRVTLDALLAARGQSENVFALAGELRPEDMLQVFCAGRLDAFVYVVGFPVQAIEAATRDCHGHLVNVEGVGVDRLLERHPYYTRVTIPGGTYAHTPEDIHTFGVRATLMTRADVDEETVHALVAAVFAHLEALRSRHPSMATLDPEEMSSAGLTAPLHQGARRYYEEAGLPLPEHDDPR